MPNAASDEVIESKNVLFLLLWLHQEAVGFDTEALCFAEWLWAALCHLVCHHTALEFAGALQVESLAAGRDFLLTYLLINKKRYKIYLQQFTNYYTITSAAIKTSRI